MKILRLKYSIINIQKKKKIRAKVSKYKFLIYKAEVHLHMQLHSENNSLAYARMLYNKYQSTLEKNIFFLVIIISVNKRSTK